MIRILWTQKEDAIPTARTYPVMAYDSSRGRTVLFGGLGAGPFGDTWEWDGANWTQLADSGPPARWGSAMAYDAQRNQTVLFSGSNGANDTWAWDGRNWTQLADSGLLPRVRSAMAYDSKRQRIVLFGGTPAFINGATVGATNETLNTAPGNTWEWDGVSWTQQAETGPTQRNSHSMAYDSTRQRTVLFGGMGNDALGDTWEWDGSVWTEVRDFGATPCFLAALAFKADSVALFGGTNTNTQPYNVFGSTWTWDGKNWTLRQNFGPAPRFGHVMSYDTKRATLVLFGGVAASSNYLGDTWEHSEGP